MSTARVNFQKVRDVPDPEYHSDLAAGFDLAIAVEARLYCGESKVFPTGLIIQTPAHHMLLVTPRSSTWRKWGVTLGNTIGIVDEDYCGPEDELMLYLHRPERASNFPIIIPAGTRLAQGIFVPVTRGIFRQSETPLAQTRGGWGSTGD